VEFFATGVVARVWFVVVMVPNTFESDVSRADEQLISLRDQPVKQKEERYAARPRSYRT
jgi:hypothetical protein